MFNQSWQHTHEADRQLYQRGKCILQPDILSNLPGELLHTVLSLLANPDKVALALTCKHHMAMVESVRKLPIKRPTITKPMRLAVLVRLHEWMPPGLTLCYSCIKFISSVENGPWQGDGDVRKKKLANTTAIKYGPRCNPCHRRDEMESVKAGMNARRLKKLVQKME